MKRIKRNIPENLQDKQEKQRSETVKTITDSILELQSLGYKIKIQDIIDATGLSRSVFAKKHVRDILLKYGILKNDKKFLSISLKDNKSKKKDILEKKDEYIQELREENKKLQYEIEILRGKLHLLMYEIENKN